MAACIRLWVPVSLLPLRCPGTAQDTRQGRINLVQTTWVSKIQSSPECRGGVRGVFPKFFSVIAILDNIQLNSSLRQYSMEKLGLFTGVNKGYINLKKWEGILLRMKVHC